MDKTIQISFYINGFDEKCEKLMKTPSNCANTNARIHTGAHTNTHTHTHTHTHTYIHTHTHTQTLLTCG